MQRVFDKMLEKEYGAIDYRKFLAAGMHGSATVSKVNRAPRRHSRRIRSMTDMRRGRNPTQMIAAPGLM